MINLLIVQASYSPFCKKKGKKKPDEPRLGFSRQKDEKRTETLREALMAWGKTQHKAPPSASSSCRDLPAITNNQDLDPSHQIWIYGLVKKKNSSTAPNTNTNRKLPAASSNQIPRQSPLGKNPIHCMPASFSQSRLFLFFFGPPRRLTYTTLTLASGKQEKSG